MHGVAAGFQPGTHMNSQMLKILWNLDDFAAPAGDFRGDSAYPAPPMPEHGGQP